MNGFTRQETMVLTGAKTGSLSYWDESDLIVPQKYGNAKHPTVIYSAEQIVQIKIVDKLRRQLSLQEIRKIIKSVRVESIVALRPDSEAHIVFVDGKICFADDMCKLGSALIEALKNSNGQIEVKRVTTIGNVIPEVKQQAQRNCVLDFDKRVAGTILDAPNI